MRQNRFDTFTGLTTRDAVDIQRGLVQEFDNSIFNDSAARGDKQPDKVEVSNEQVALAALMKGLHF